MRFDLPKQEEKRNIIRVIGVGGGGSNAVNHMFKQGIVGVDFAICNTDNQAMEASPVPTKIKLGPNLTEGMGAGAQPQVGKQACLESIDDIKAYLTGAKMLFVTAGMGGGTGTGAAPIIAKAAKEMDILTVGIVTLPFRLEGKVRLSQGMEGLEELKKNVDSILVISNEKLLNIFTDFTMSSAFAQADDILTTAARAISEIITKPGLINIDFKDVDTIIRGSGVAIMGTGYGEGENRAYKAIDMAISSPLLEENDIKSAQQMLVHVVSGTKEATMMEMKKLEEFIREEVNEDVNLILGTCHDHTLGDKISITIIATGFNRTAPEDGQNKSKQTQAPPRKNIVFLEDDYEQSLQNKQHGIFGIDKSDPHLQNTFEFRSLRPANKPTSSLPKETDAKRESPQRPASQPMAKHSQPPLSIEQLENKPAYLRREVRLDDNLLHSSSSSVSQWTVSDKDDVEIRANNSFLHDKAD